MLSINAKHPLNSVHRNGSRCQDQSQIALDTFWTDNGLSRLGISKVDVCETKTSSHDAFLLAFYKVIVHI